VDQQFPKTLRSQAPLVVSDRIDRAILAALRQNARLSNKELATRVGVAESTCHERVKRLVNTGVLRGFHADVDPKALGIGLQALVAVRLARHASATVASFREAMLRVPEAVAVLHIAGANDFLVHVAVRDVEALRDLILRVFTARPEIVHIETSLIYEHVQSTRLPVAD
jgi:DNA-binding Lrp family transcriptional regulator